MALSFRILSYRHFTELESSSPHARYSLLLEIIPQAEKNSSALAVGGKWDHRMTPQRARRRWNQLLTKEHFTAEVGSVGFYPFLLSFDT